MHSASFFVAGVLPYLAVTFFVIGSVYRLLAWRRVPQPGLMTLYPTKGATARALAKEALFFPSLYRGDRSLWSLAWIFHVALALALVGHLRVVTGLLDRGLATLGLDAAHIGAISTIAGGAAGVTLILTVLALLARRILLARVREISSAPDFVALLLLVAVITSGDVLRFGAGQLDLGETRRWAASLLRLSPILPANPAFLVHLFCGQLLLLYVAFSKLMHFGGFFFSFSLIKRSAP
jgi:nitrate reductase gamma subunit